MVKTKLFDYQEKTVQRIGIMLKRDRFVMLEAGMGVGKSLMTLATISHLSVPYAIIVAPKTLLRNWQGEFEKHLDEIPNLLVWDSQKAKSDRFKEAETMLLKNGGVFLVNIEAFQRDNEQLLRLCKKIQHSGQCISIVDESSKIKDPSSHRTKAMARNFVWSTYKMCLTGTMSANSPLDVYGQFRYLDPLFWVKKGFRTWQIFRGYFAILVTQFGPNGVTFKRIATYRRVQELRGLIEPNTILIDKYEVLDLPDKVYSRINVELSSDERRAYRDLKSHMMTILKSGEVIAVDQALSLYNKFRQITGGWIAPDIQISDSIPSKLSALLDMMEDSDEQVVIFAVFTHEIIQIQRELMGIGIVAERYDGSVSQYDRAEIIKRFNAKDVQVLVVQPKAGAYGLNLQANCNTIVYYSRPNSPEEYLQSQDRIHRIGQTNTCFYIDLVAIKTIDEMVIAALDKKEDFSRLFKNMSAKEIEEL